MVKTCLIKQVFCNIFSFIELIRWLVQSSFLAAHGWPDFLVYQINCQLTWIFNKEWVAFPWVMNSCEAFFSLKQFGTLCWNCNGQGLPKVMLVAMAILIKGYVPLSIGANWRFCYVMQMLIIVEKLPHFCEDALIRVLFL